MGKESVARIGAYITAPILTITGFTLASLFFLFVIKDPSPIPVFIAFGTVQSLFMILYALLPGRGKLIARMIPMYLIGLFLFILVGILGKNNFQLEGFFFYLTTGTLSGVLVHFMMAKIAGPILFSRSWCSWGCWTSMVFDLLPFKTHTTWRTSKLANLRYAHFFASLLIVVVMHFVLDRTIIHKDPQALKAGMGTMTEMGWFLVGNSLYYLIGVGLAIGFKDNRAFCKYICPLTVFLRFTNRFTLLRIRGKKERCDNCKTCVSHCPMSISIPEYIQNDERVKSTECIMCMNCITNCPKATLSTSIGFDFAGKDKLLHK